MRSKRVSSSLMIDSPKLVPPHSRMVKSKIVAVKTLRQQKQKLVPLPNSALTTITAPTTLALSSLLLKPPYQQNSFSSSFRDSSSRTSVSKPIGSSSSMTMQGLEALKQQALQQEVAAATATMHSTSRTMMMMNPSMKIPYQQTTTQKAVERLYRTSQQKWLGMKPMPFSESLRQDLTVLCNRHALDPKRFYKKNNTEWKALLKQSGGGGGDKPVLEQNRMVLMQVGTVVSGSSNHAADNGGAGNESYATRLSRRERRQGTLLDQLLVNPIETAYTRKTYNKHQQQNQHAATLRKQQQPGRRRYK